MTGRGIAAQSKTNSNGSRDNRFIFFAILSFWSTRRHGTRMRKSADNSLNQLGRLRQDFPYIRYSDALANPVNPTSVTEEAGAPPRQGRVAPVATVRRTRVCPFTKLEARQAVKNFNSPIDCRVGCRVAETEVRVAGAECLARNDEQVIANCFFHEIRARTFRHARIQVERATGPNELITPLEPRAY